MLSKDLDLESMQIQYGAIPDFFVQDKADTDPATFDYANTNFGLIDRIYNTDTEHDPDREKTQWQRFKHHISRMNSQSDCTVSYKLLYLARHGEGVHNVAENLYGSRDWDAYWSKLDGNDTLTWSDAHLTQKGEQQALAASQFWADMLTTQHIPFPESYYASPLSRCLSTANITFSTLHLPSSHPFRPVVKELLREAIGEHTCDRRSSKTYIQETFPNAIIEKGFTQQDELWRPDVRETDKETDARVKELLDDIFTNDRSTFVSLTSHSGAISAILRVVGHREFRLQTGGAIPVLVKAEWSKTEPSK